MEHAVECGNLKKEHAVELENLKKEHEAKQETYQWVGTVMSVVAVVAIGFLYSNKK